MQVQWVLQCAYQKAVRREDIFLKRKNGGREKAVPRRHLPCQPRVEPSCRNAAALPDYKLLGIKIDGGVSSWRLRLSWRTPTYLLPPAMCSVGPMSLSLSIPFEDLKDEFRPNLALCPERGSLNS